MNMIESFNKTIKYIETVLDDKIDEKMISYISGYSFPMFSRLFSILTGQTLAEYIRFRKLTLSAIDLRETDFKIIDIAFKYGYESPDSFATAFKNYHGFTPTEIRNGKPFKVFSRVQLTLSIKGGRNMKITIQKKSGFKVAGISAKDIDTHLCSQVWNDLFKRYSDKELSDIGNGQSYGICYDVENSNKINYMAGFDVTDIEKANKLGLEIMSIDDAEYAVVELNGRVPDCIHEGWKYVMEVFFPENGYSHSGKPDFEVYGEGDMYGSDYSMELWIPVVK